jgi:NAD(P)-dependent dehydrogenase (short-subunit alcohol dehydrogenase family)
MVAGNSGIGFETAKQMALRNARVYIASRSEDRVSKAIQDMDQSAGRRLDLHYLQIDLQNLKSVHTAALNFMERESRLDILINNAGVRTLLHSPP